MLSLACKTLHFCIHGLLWQYVIFPVQMQRAVHSIQSILYLLELARCQEFLTLDFVYYRMLQVNLYVTNDGAETDLDLGHYERFLNVPTSQEVHTPNF